MRFKRTRWLNGEICLVGILGSEHGKLLSEMIELNEVAESLEAALEEVGISDDVDNWPMLP